MLSTHPTDLPTPGAPDAEPAPSEAAAPGVAEMTHGPVDTALDVGARATSESSEPAAIEEDRGADVLTSSDSDRVHEPGRLARAFADRGRVLATLTTFVSVALVATVLATFVVGYPQLKNRASEVQMSPVSVVFEWPALAGQKTSRPERPGGEPRTWVNAELRSELAKLALTILSDDPLDVRTLERCRTALLSTGWFQDDLRLVRDESNTVHVRGTWRTPVAAVRVENMDQLVSARGELLSPRYAAGTSGMKTIVGVRTKPPELGQVWLGGEVQAALKLIGELADRPSFPQVASVDVTEFLASRNLIILTDRGGRIYWGGEPDQFTPGQPSTETKLARLDNVFKRFGRIDAGRAVLDVRVIDGVYVHDTEGIMSSARAETGSPVNDPR